MNIGFIGLGKLGLPTAFGIEARGHRVFGYDPSPLAAHVLATRVYPFKEIQAQEYLNETKLELRSLEDTVRDADILFVTIQTPHAPRYEGITRLPPERRDFDYEILKKGMIDVSAAIERLGEDRIVVIVSTVLPGTIRREILPVLGSHSKVCYNPFFIAMGTTIPDFFGPEFVLFGVDDEHAAARAEEFYRTIHDAPFYKTTIENAELIKVVYNTAISTKIAFTNTVMEIAHRTGANADAVIGALKLADKRIISTRYLDGGMGDGGGCHPRDNIALSWLSQRLGMTYDWFECVMMQRERQTEWLADLAVQHAAGRRILILGTSFKAESNIEVGSPALLLKAILEERGHHVATWDPFIDPKEGLPTGAPLCYFIGTKHEEFASFPFEPGSVVIDPWRYVVDRPGVDVIRIGG